MSQSFRFAHVSDIHLPTFIGDCSRPGAFLNKRFFSALSWFGNRRNIHHKTVTDHMVKDLLARAPAHILVTGDLTNLSLPGEYDRAAGWLQSLGTPIDVTAIPGNHDLLLDEGGARDGLLQLAPYMRGDGQQNARTFPFTKRKNDIIFIGLSTAIETPAGWCSGRLGETQRDHLREVLSKARRENLCRIIALHHPPAGPQKPRGGLEDIETFAQIIAKTGAELILHGHTHCSSMHTLSGPDGPVPVMGVASLSVRAGKHYPVSCWHEYEVQRVQGVWKISLNVHRYAGRNLPTTLAAQVILNSA